MNQRDKSIASGMKSLKSKLFAPAERPGPAQNLRGGSPPDLQIADRTSGKKRVMSRLFDKLKAAAHNDGSSTRDPLESKSGSSLALEANDLGPDGLAQNDDPDLAWLAETRVSGFQSMDLKDTNARPMNFSYAPGSTPLPRYTIRRGIGVGGFGEVYFAVTDAGKEVALKRIQRNLEIELRGVSHCLNLKHPNLVALYDICPDEHDQWWVVMEFVAGPNLREVLDDSPNGLAPEEVNRWFSGIAAGVAHLHSAGLVHRDLKPGNVFDDMGIVKVGDYGLSKFISTSHRGGHTESVGTFHYMAPEIGRGQYGREIDIYAMGIVLYELLTGGVPFDGESCQEIIVKHMTAIPDLNAVAQPYRSTIARCLEKDPARRYSTIAEMLHDLKLGLPSTGLHGPTPVHLTDFSVPDIPITATIVDPQPSVVVPQAVGSQAAGAQAVGSQAAGAQSGGLSDEPFARAIRHSLHDLNLWWRTLDRSPGAKAGLTLAAVFVLLINTHWLLPLLSVLGIVYVPYYIARQMVLHVRQQPSYAQAQRLATHSQRQPFPMTKTQWRSHMRGGLRAKHSVHRIAELNTSWIAATLTVAALATIAGVVGLRSGPVTPMTVAPYGWMAMIVLMSSLGILGMGKLWEREDGEGLTRRLVLAGVGAGVGAIAYAMSEFLMLPLDRGLLRDVDSSTLPQALYSNEGVPLLSAMMAHFAVLFACLRWWKPVDPLRRTRLSLWSVAVAVVAEWAVHQVLPIPQPTGMLMAGGIAIAVQMAAPWVRPGQIQPGQIQPSQIQPGQVQPVSEPMSTPQPASAQSRSLA